MMIYINDHLHYIEEESAENIWRIFFFVPKNIIPIFVAY